LEQLQVEKEGLIRQVEQEEEHLTNTLQKKLRKLEIDKIELQQRLEQEEEFIVNKLQKQLQQVTHEKSELQRRLQEGAHGLISTLHDGVQRVREMETSLGPEQSLLKTSEMMDLVWKMRTELEAMHTAQNIYKRERDAYKKRAEEFQEKLKESDQQNFLLKQKVLQEQEHRKQMVERACITEQSMEMNIERELNTMIRRNSHSSQSPRSDMCISPRLAGLASPIHSPRLFNVSLDQTPAEVEIENLAKQARSPRRQHVPQPFGH
jgi:coiled-coil domain-containing protein 6